MISKQFQMVMNDIHMLKECIKTKQNKLNQNKKQSQIKWTVFYVLNDKNKQFHLKFVWKINKNTFKKATKKAT